MILLFSFSLNFFYCFSSPNAGIVVNCPVDFKALTVSIFCISKSKMEYS